MLLNILGGGGSGKTTLKLALLRMEETYAGLVSYTTRPRRPEEKDGVHYHFVSVESYLSNSTLTLKREADGWLYGVDQRDLELHTETRVVVTTFDVDGIRALEKTRKAVKVVYLNIPEEERRRRMLLRGDDPSAVSRRILIDRERLRNPECTFPLLEIRGGGLDEIVRRAQAFVASGGTSERG